MRATTYSQCRVLIVERALMVRRSLRQTLLQLGVEEVGFAASHDEAIAALRGGHYNAVFTDWSRDVDAVQLLVALRRSGDERLQALPVVVATSQASGAQMAIVRNAGMTEFMIKPFQPSIVESRLRAIIENPRVFIVSEYYIGPDRRRFRAQFEGPNRRQHTNIANNDRRRHSQNHVPPGGVERRHGRQGYAPPERRDGGR